VKPLSRTHQLLTTHHERWAVLSELCGGKNLPGKTQQAVSGPKDLGSILLPNFVFTPSSSNFANEKTIRSTSLGVTIYNVINATSMLQIFARSCLHCTMSLQGLFPKDSCPRNYTRERKRPGNRWVYVLELCLYVVTISKAHLCIPNGDPPTTKVG
jgi:hypothetical protein